MRCSIFTIICLNFFKHSEARGAVFKNIGCRGGGGPIKNGYTNRGCLENFDFLSTIPFFGKDPGYFKILILTTFI